MSMLGIFGVQKRASFPWNLSNRDCGLPCEFLESNPDPLEELPVLLINEPSLYLHFFKKKYFSIGNVI